MNLNILSLSWKPSLASNIEVQGSPMKSLDTTSSSTYSITPFIYVSEASLTLAHTSAYVAGFFSLTLRSTTDTSAVGTLYAIPVILPLSDGITSATAFAAPVVVGMMLLNTLLPVLQSFIDLASTTFCFAVAA